MTHEEFLQQLVLGFAGDSTQRQPGYSGVNEEDAVLRWIAYNVAMYIHEKCQFEPDRGRVAIVSVERVWYHWRPDGHEDVDFMLGGVRTGQMHGHAVKVQATQHLAGSYALRISDWTTRNVVDAQGDRSRQNGRVLIRDHDRPYVWTLPRTSGGRTTATWHKIENLRLPPCCQTARRNIRNVVFGTGGVRTFLPLTAIFGELTADDMVQAIFLSDWEELHSRADRFVSPIQRNRVQTMCDWKILEHQSDGRLREFWESFYEAFG